VHTAAFNDYLMSVDIVLDDIPALKVTQEEVIDLRNGKALKLSFLAQDETLLKAIDNDNQKLIALGKSEMDYFRPTRVFNY
jgi:tRNA U55 pseudouridine synthase TruB